MGSDVGQSQQVDPMVAERDPINDEVRDSLNEITTAGDIPYRMHFVVTSPEHLLAKESVINHIITGATRDLLTGKDRKSVV